jgi:hypothetical protein
MAVHMKHHFQTIILNRHTIILPSKTINLILIKIDECLIKNIIDHQEIQINYAHQFWI